MEKWRGFSNFNTFPLYISTQPLSYEFHNSSRDLISIHLSVCWMLRSIKNNGIIFFFKVLTPYIRPQGGSDYKIYKFTYPLRKLTSFLWQMLLRGWKCSKVMMHNNKKWQSGIAIGHLSDKGNLQIKVQILSPFWNCVSLWTFHYRYHAIFDTHAA